MPVGYAVLSFLLLLAVLRLAVWPLVVPAAAVVAAASPAGSESSDPALLGSPPLAAMLPDPAGQAGLDDVIEQAVAARRAYLLRSDCPGCGGERAAGDRFCRACGHRLVPTGGERQ